PGWTDWQSVLRMVCFRLSRESVNRRRRRVQGSESRTAGGGRRIFGTASGPPCTFDSAPAPLPMAARRDCPPPARTPRSSPPEQYPWLILHKKRAQDEFIGKQRESKR